jgi:AraC-like DNA-binding protein
VPCILVVDDDDAVREALHALLSDSYCVHTAGSGRQALTLLQQDPVDATILDVFLGDEDGLSLIQDLRRVSNAAIVVLTGRSSEEIAIRACRAKVDGYLRKPPNLAELATTLAAIVPAGPSAHSSIERARRHLDQRRDLPHERRELAEVAGLSDRHLRRQFAAMYGTTPRRYQVGIRLTRAAELLRCTDLPIKQIAVEAGFSTLHAFERAFKHAYCVTPTAFRIDILPPRSATEPDRASA